MTTFKKIECMTLNNYSGCTEKYKPYTFIRTVGKEAVKINL